MIHSLATIFIDGLQISGGQKLLLVLPLCLSIAIVYKTLRCEKTSQIFTASLILWCTIVVGMYALGLGLWVLFSVTA